MTNQIQCPNCGSFNTTPYPVNGNSAEDEMKFMLKLTLSVGLDHSFNNLKCVKQFQSGEIGAYCHLCKLKFNVKTSHTKSASLSFDKSSPNEQHDIEGKLTALKNLHAKGLINEDEYKRKKEELLKSL